jgi:hypothetical protein
MDCFATLAMTKKLILLAMMAAGCDRDRPPAPTAEQSNQLNEAEAMLDDLAAKEESPADRSTGPSNSSN